MVEDGKPGGDRVDAQDSALSRREFLAGAAGVGLAIGSARLLNIPAVFAATTRSSTGMVFRTLGKTKQKVSVVSLGAMECTNPAVVHRALDYGVNYIDTAECYQGGNNEKMVGQVLRTRRKEAFLATKWHTDGVSTTKQQLIGSAEASLSRLGISTIDLISIHGAESRQQLEQPAMREAFLELRRAGKVRFMGFSHHSMNPVIIRQGIKAGWFDVIFLGYNFMASADLKAAVAEAKRAGIGIVVMKSVAPSRNPRAREFFGDIKTSPQVAAIQWVINDPNVSTCNVGMTTFEQVDEGLKAVGKPLRKAEAEALEQFAAASSSEYCRLCAVCNNHCPQGIAVADIMRCSMYHENYGNAGLATATYAALPRKQQLAACTLCGACNSACPYGVAVTERLQRAATYLV
jgi:uncharacterized protein